MKLYAQVTSERASKGQGGNKHLEILLKCHDERTNTYDNVATVRMTQLTGGAVTMRFTSLVSEKMLDIPLPTRYNKLQKGKRQKGEDGLCRHIQKDCPICHKK